MLGLIYTVRHHTSSGDTVFPARRRPVEVRVSRKGGEHVCEKG